MFTVSFNETSLATGDLHVTLVKDILNVMLVGTVGNGFKII